jgi:inosine/xanthosine triphosphatase
MKINVGSKNQTKIAAVRQAVILYPDLFPKPKVCGIDVPIERYGHPNTIAKIVEGARNRAQKSFTDCRYSFGIESGFIEVPYTLTGYMEIAACVVYDGTDFYTGLSPAFEWPQKVTEMICTDSIDGSEAFRRLGYTTHEKLGAASGGIIGYLTNGRLTRERCTVDSILIALIYLEKPDLR